MQERSRNASIKPRRDLIQKKALRATVFIFRQNGQYRRQIVQTAFKSL